MKFGPSGRRYRASFISPGLGGNPARSIRGYFQLLCEKLDWRRLLSPDRSQFGVYRGFHHAAALEEVDQVGGEPASGLERW